MRVATPADVDRLWPLFDEVENNRIFLADGKGLDAVERRRSDLVELLVDLERPVLVAYSGIRAVGYLPLPGRKPYVSASWRGLGVEQALLDFLR